MVYRLKFIISSKIRIKWNLNNDSWLIMERCAHPRMVNASNIQRKSAYALCIWYPIYMYMCFMHITFNIHLHMLYAYIIQYISTYALCIYHTKHILICFMHIIYKTHPHMLYAYNIPNTSSYDICIIYVNVRLKP